jgi:hypothetical protein
MTATLLAPLAACGPNPPHSRAYYEDHAAEREKALKDCGRLGYYFHTACRDAVLAAGDQSFQSFILGRKRNGDLGPHPPLEPSTRPRSAACLAVVVATWGLLSFASGGGMTLLRIYPSQAACEAAKGRAVGSPGRVLRCARRVTPDQMERHLRPLRAPAPATV